MRELLLAREEVHWLVCLFTQPQITIFLLFAYIKVSTFQEYQNMSQSTKKQGTSIVLFPLWVFIFCLCLNGCTVLNINSFHFGKLGKKEQGQAVKYEICSGKNMPERLQKIIEERKKKPEHLHIRIRNIHIWWSVMGRNPIVVTVSGWSNVGKIRSSFT